MYDQRIRREYKRDGEKLTVRNIVVTVNSPECNRVKLPLGSWQEGVLSLVN